MFICYISFKYHHDTQRISQEQKEKEKANQKEIDTLRQMNQRTLQETQKKARAEKEAKLKIILDLKQEIESLKEINKALIDQQRESQIQMNGMKEEIKILKMEAQQVLIQCIPI